MQKISGIQMLFLMTTFNLGMALMAVISPTVQKAHQDAWISIGLATAASMGFTYLAIRLSSLYPEKSFVACFKIVFGPFVGIPVLFIYAAQWIVVTGVAVRQIVDFAMPALQLYDTPSSIILVCILFISAYTGIAGGIESLARCSEIITPLVLSTLIIITVMAFRIHALSNLLPIMQPHLAQNLISGAIPSTSFLAQSTIVMVIYPYLANKKSHLAGLWGTGIAGLFLMLDTLQVTATFGPNLPQKMWNPFFMLTRYISIGDFIQNIDAIVVVIWFLSAFIRIALYSWVAAQVSSDLTGINLSWCVALVCALAIAVSWMPSSIVGSTIKYPSSIVEPFVLPVLNIGLPILGLVIAMFRERLRARQ